MFFHQQFSKYFCSIFKNLTIKKLAKIAAPKPNIIKRKVATKLCSAFLAISPKVLFANLQRGTLEKQFHFEMEMLDAEQASKHATLFPVTDVALQQRLQMASSRQAAACLAAAVQNLLTFSI